MKRALAALLVLAVSMPVMAQSLEEKRDQKKDSKWIKDGGWTTDYDKARELAKKSNTYIFTYFTRSYAG